MTLKHNRPLLFHLAVTGWLVLCIIAVSSGSHHEQKTISDKLRDKPLEKSRIPRNAYEEGDIISQPPKFLYIRTAPAPTIEVKLQDTTTLECEAGGSPPPVIHWLKDNGKIIQDDFLQTNELPNIQAVPHGLSSTKSRLFVDCMSATDEGSYSCVADTPYQRVSANSNIYLSAHLPVVLNPYCIPQKKSMGHNGQPARIHMWTARLLQTMANDVVMFCRATGEPTPLIRWHTDDRYIENGSKYQLLDNGDLLIRHIDWNDMGEYTCEAENLHGKDAVSTFLYPMAPGDN